VTLRRHANLPPKLAELSVLVTVHHFNCSYASHTHSVSALAKGLPASLIDAIKSGKRADFSAVIEAAVYDFCIELHTTHRVSDRTYKLVCEGVGAEGAVELTALIGYYLMVAMMLNAHDYPAP